TRSISIKPLTAGRSTPVSSSRRGIALTLTRPRTTPKGTRLVIQRKILAMAVVQCQILAMPVTEAMMTDSKVGDPSHLQRPVDGVRDVVADAPCGAKRYERSPDRVGPRAGSCTRRRQTEVACTVRCARGGAIASTQRTRQVHPRAPAKLVLLKAVRR